MVIGKKSVMSVGFKTREGVVHPKVSSFCCFLHRRIINNNVRIFSSRSLFRFSKINSIRIIRSDIYKSFFLSSINVIVCRKKLRKKEIRKNDTRHSEDTSIDSKIK